MTKEALMSAIDGSLTSGPGASMGRGRMSMDGSWMVHGWSITNDQCPRKSQARSSKSGGRSIGRRWRDVQRDAIQGFAGAACTGSELLIVKTRPGY